MFHYKMQLVKCLFNCRNTIIIWKRFKSKNNTKLPCTKALEHFDDFYKSIFKNKWPSVRLALLSRRKTVAVINNFGNSEKTKSLLESEGATDLKKLFECEKEKYDCLNTSNTNFEANQLDSIITEKLKEEKKKEFSLIYKEKRDECSNDILFCEKSSGENSNHEKEEFEITNSNTSLHDDLAEAEYDEHRLIVPGMESVTGLQDFIPTSKLRGLDSYIPESEYYKFYEKKSGLPITVVEEENFEFPESLKVFTFYRGDFTMFPETQKCENEVLNFFEIDGASILPVLALDIKLGDVVLNLCSRSNSSWLTALSIFQTLRAKLFVCEENKNVENIFSQYLFDYSPTWQNMFLLTSHYFDEEEDKDLFDKILVEVPCTSDRNSLFEETDNIFSPLKIRKRLQLPQSQAHLLLRALRLVRPGGTVVYSTNTLSPVQNDGVVQEALKVMWEENKTSFTIKNMTPALAHTSFLFNYGNNIGLKYGTLIVPFLPSNFGPKYFCKIIKNKE